MIVAATPEAIARAAELLAEGALVAFPTETVYGLGTNARSDTALERLYRVKGRPGEHPVIVHIASAASLPRWSRDVPEYAMALAQGFWPGPLTLVLPRAAGVSERITGGQGSVGLRVPAHPVAQALLSEFARRGGDGIAAPSANRFGRISATRAQHVADEFGGDVALVLDGGACDHGIESTIVDCTGAGPVVLRPGAISVQAITRALGFAPGAPGPNPTRASGTLASHYSPRTPARLLAPAALNTALAARTDAATVAPRVAVLARTVARPKSFTGAWQAAPAEAPAYAHALYASLRALDASGAGEIWIEAPPEDSEWIAINDRLARATHRG